MNLLRYLIPIGLFGYFAFRARKSPVYACALPMLYCFGEAIMLPIYSLSLAIPGLPVNLNKGDVAFFLLATVWLYIRQKRPNRRKLAWGLDFGSLWLLFAVFAIQPFAIAISEGVLYESSILNSRAYVYFPLSLLLWADALRRFTWDEVWHLLVSVSAVTVLLMPLYILSAVGVAIYPSQSYRVYAGSSIIVRDYVTFPIWTGLALAFYLSQYIQGKRLFEALPALSVLVVGCVLTLTRNVVFASGGMVAVALLVSMRRVRMIPVTMLRIGLVAVALALSMILLQTFALGNLQMLVSRLESFAIAGSREVNVAARLGTFSEIAALVQSTDPVFGLGFVGGREWAVPYHSEFGLGHSMWMQMLLVTGWSGVVALVLLLVVFAWNGFVLMLSRNPKKSQMGLLAFVVIIWRVVRSSASSGYLDFVATATFALSLIVVEKRDLWAVNPVTVPRIPFWRGISLNWFTRDDEFKLWRRLALAALVSYIAIRIGLRMAT